MNNLKEKNNEILILKKRIKRYEEKLGNINLNIEESGFQLTIENLTIDRKDSIIIRLKNKDELFINKTITL